MIVAILVLQAALAASQSVDPTPPPTRMPSPAPTMTEAPTESGLKQCNLWTESKVKDCGEYIKSDSAECYGQGQGCVGIGWFSKDNISEPNQRVNAHAICRLMGYADGADEDAYGGNWGHQCRYPGNNLDTVNRAGGALESLGWTVTWRCAGVSTCFTHSPTPPPVPTMQPTHGCFDEPPSPIVDCGADNGSLCTGKGMGCVKDGWFSKVNSKNPNLRVDAHKMCREAGYTAGADTLWYGGNWGDQCRFPGSSKTAANKAGGNLSYLGFTVTWKCKGNKLCSPTQNPTSAPGGTPNPTPLPTAKSQCPDPKSPYPDDCTRFEKKECQKDKIVKSVCRWTEGECIGREMDKKSTQKARKKYCKLTFSKKNAVWDDLALKLECCKADTQCRPVTSYKKKTLKKVGCKGIKP